MQHPGEMFCSFCKTSDSQLITHSLCHCCLGHLECSDASAEKPISVVPKEDAVRKVECNTCHEEYREDELQHHRTMCMSQWVFQCSVCDGDYLSKEGLWNHLVLHEITDEKRELHCQEKRASYKVYNCKICNDQRCYQVISYWKHVHEDHDGFFLRCSGCGESFRSQKHKTDHILNHCKHREQIVPSESAELDVDYAYGITTVDKQHSTQAPEERCEVLEKDINNFEANQADQQDSLVDDTDNDKIRNNNETEEASHETLLSQAENKDSGFRCPHCDKQFATDKHLACHIRSLHKPATCDICGVFFSSGNKAYYHKLTKHPKTNYKCAECSKEFMVKQAYQRHLIRHHQVERKFNCKDCGSAFKTSGDLKQHTKITHTRYENLQIENNSRLTKTQEQKQSKSKKDCPICQESFNGDKEFSQHVQEIHTVSICTICKLTFTSALELAEHKCTTCSDCGKECYQQMRLKSHIKLCHELMKCDVCEASIPGESQLELHKTKVHGEPKYKCTHCSQKFHLKGLYQRHMVKYTGIKSFPCDYCDRKFKSLRYVVTHMRRTHRLKMSRKDAAKYTKLKRNDVSSGEVAFELESIVKADETTLLKPEYPPESSSTIDSISSEQQVEDAFKLESIVEVEETTLLKHEYSSESSASIEQVAEDTNNGAATMNSSKPLRYSTRRKYRKRKVSRAIGENPSTKPSDTVCPHCGKQCYRKSRLITHITLRHDLTECDICGISLVGKNQARYHKLTAHSEPKFKCPQCPMKFHLKDSYRRHLSMHVKYSKVFPCKSCDSEFKTLVLLNKHMKLVHFIRKRQTDFTNSSKLETGLEIQKVEKISIKMEASEEKSPLQQHKSQASDGADGELTSQATAMNNPVKCPQCGKKLPHEFSLSRHIKANHQPTSCEICGITFKSKGKLGYHKRTTHVEPKYECPHCSEKFHVQSSYERHVEHHAVNKFPCKFCSLMFKNARSTSLHVRQTHLGKGHASWAENK